jgi:hypothetical protein
MSYSWFLDPDIPRNQNIYPTQATAFASSSLASASSSFLAYDGGLQEITIIPQTQGNRQLNNLAIASEDKSALGIAVRRRAAALQFTLKDPNALTVPNKYSLSRNTLLL